MFNTIVVGTDGSPSAERVVDVARRMAYESAATLHLVMAHRTAESLMPAGGVWGFVPADDTGALRERCLAERALAVTLDRIGGGIRVRTHIVGGDPAASIVDIARRVLADLIVVGNRGMRGPHRLIGSVPNSVAHRAPCSVLVVRSGD